MQAFRGPAHSNAPMERSQCKKARASTGARFSGEVQRRPPAGRGLQARARSVRTLDRRRFLDMTRDEKAAGAQLPEAAFAPALRGCDVIGSDRRLRQCEDPTLRQKREGWGHPCRTKGAATKAGGHAGEHTGTACRAPTAMLQEFGGNYRHDELTCRREPAGSSKKRKARQPQEKKKWNLRAV